MEKATNRKCSSVSIAISERWLNMKSTTGLLPNATQQRFGVTQALEVCRGHAITRIQKLFAGVIADDLALFNDGDSIAQRQCLDQVVSHEHSRFSQLCLQSTKFVLHLGTC